MSDDDSGGGFEAPALSRPEMAPKWLKYVDVELLRELRGRDTIPGILTFGTKGEKLILPSRQKH